MYVQDISFKYVSNTYAPYFSSVLIQAEDEVCPKLWYVQNKSKAFGHTSSSACWTKRLTSSRCKGTGRGAVVVIEHMLVEACYFVNMLRHYIETSAVKQTV